MTPPNHTKRAFFIQVPEKTSNRNAPYSPQLNPIERLWKWLKDAVIANVFHKDQMDIDQAIARFMEYIDQQPEEVLRRLGCAA
ncbi:transposase [Parageobacillus toebii]|uniref:transposase n=1 Tax=Parageobacillus toebii TaxID=153151 RepID=UPI001F482607|nr:transposase [Parageobacillus toebii]